MDRRKRGGNARVRQGSGHHLLAAPPARAGHSTVLSRALCFGTHPPAAPSPAAPRAHLRASSSAPGLCPKPPANGKVLLTPLIKTAARKASCELGLVCCILNHFLVFCPFPQWAPPPSSAQGGNGCPCAGGLGTWPGEQKPLVNKPPLLFPSSLPGGGCKGEAT